jgi:hypothetical protein
MKRKLSLAKWLILVPLIMGASSQQGCNSDQFFEGAGYAYDLFSTYMSAVSAYFPSYSVFPQTLQYTPSEIFPSGYNECCSEGPSDGGRCVVCGLPSCSQ